MDFLATLERFESESARLRLFKRFLTDSLPPRSMAFYLNVVHLIRVSVEHMLFIWLNSLMAFHKHVFSSATWRRPAAARVRQ